MLTINLDAESAKAYLVASSRVNPSATPYKFSELFCLGLIYQLGDFASCLARLLSFDEHPHIKRAKAIRNFYFIFYWSVDCKL